MVWSLSSHRTPRLHNGDYGDDDMHADPLTDKQIAVPMCQSTLCHFIGKDNLPVCISCAWVIDQVRSQFVRGRQFETYTFLRVSKSLIHSLFIDRLAIFLIMQALCLQFLLSCVPYPDILSHFIITQTSYQPERPGSRRSIKYVALD